ncbi:MAG: DUF3794 domain-containing protein [Eubacterium sp.]|nr:DUF3794 domain-containing protein [Eubacterium sp.]
MKIEKMPVRSGMLKFEKNVQITLDEDMNVPDTRPDMEKIVESRGDLHIDEVEVMDDRVRIKGCLLVEILYISNEKNQRISTMEHEFPLEEYMNAEGAKSTDHARVSSDIEDLSVTIINSRKCGVRSVLFFHVRISEMKFIDCTTGVDHADKVQCLYENLPITEVVMNKKDVQRIRAEISLPAGKPNIRDVLWNSMRLQDVDVRMMDGKLAIRGELFLFVMYESEDRQDPVQYYDWDIPFNNELECPDSREDLIGSISVNLGNHQTVIKPDSDGELRNLELEAVMELDILACRELEQPVLKDMYANNRHINLKTKKMHFENLVFQNNAKTKVNHRIASPGEKSRLMQILNVEGSIRIEESRVVSGGIHTQGVIFSRILFIAGEDGSPVQSREVVIPFEYLVETQIPMDNVRCEIRGVLEQIGGYVVDGNEMEIRAVAGIYVAGYALNELEMIDEAEEIPLREEDIANIPSVTGYVVKTGDTLWMIAKRFGTTIDKVKQYNENVSEPLETGRKLLLLKEMDSLIG